MERDGVVVVVVVVGVFEEMRIWGGCVVGRDEWENGYSKGTYFRGSQRTVDEPRWNIELVVRGILTSYASDETRSLYCSWILLVSENRGRRVGILVNLWE